MKRLTTFISCSVLASFLITSPVWAGVDYIRYHEDFQAQKSGAGTSDSKHLQHQSKPERDSKEQPTVNPSQEKKDTNKPAGKYDRRNWNPTE